MAISFTSNVKLLLSWIYQNQQLLANVSDSGAFTYVGNFAPTLGSNSPMYRARRTIAAASNETLNLNDGSLHDAFGNHWPNSGAAAFGVRTFAIRNLGVDNGDGTYTPTANAILQLGDAGTHPWLGVIQTGNLCVVSGGLLAMDAPLDAVGVSSTNCQLLLANTVTTGTSTHPTTYDIFIIGT